MPRERGRRLPTGGSVGMRGTASGLEVARIAVCTAVPTGPAREHGRRDRASARWRCPLRHGFEVHRVAEKHDAGVRRTGDLQMRPRKTG
jgi:hypothetical protein